MAFTVIPNSLIDADSPLDTTLFTYLRDNDDDLKALFNITTGHDHGGGTDDGATVIVNGSNIITLFNPTSGHNHGGGANSGAPTSVQEQVGGTLLASSDGEVYQNQTSWTKRKAIKVHHGGAYRISLTLRSENSNSAAEGRIYRNGVAVGTSQTTTSASPITWSEDISGWASGDEIQLYTKNSGSGGTDGHWYSNFRVYYFGTQVVYES